MLLPAFILAVGKDGYALWLILLTIVTLINALSVGHLHYASNLINLSYHQEDKKGSLEQLVSKIISSSLILVMLQLIAGALVSYTPFLSGLSKLSAQYLESHNAGPALLCLLVSRIFYLYINSFFLRLFEPFGNIRHTLKWQAASESLDLLVTALSIFISGSILVTCVAVLSVNVLFGIIAFVYVRRTVWFLRPKKIFSNSGALPFLRSSSLLNASFAVEKIVESGLNLVVVQAFSASVLPIFTTSRTMINIFYRFCYSILLPLFPGVQKQFSTGNYSYVTKIVKTYWAVSGAVIIFCITVGLPVIPYIYAYWTKNKIEFNGTIMIFLFMAILFQNFALIVTEFFKKTNFSKQLLIYNIIKASFTIIAMLAFGKLKYYDGLGAALLAGEACSMFYILVCFKKVFNDTGNIIAYLLPIYVYCISTVFYLQTKNYVVFVFLNIIAIAYSVFKFKPFIVK